MTQPSQEIIRGARAAMSRLADRNTPFIFNEWYVAAFSDEVGRSLLKRTLLGKRLVLFRTGEGKPVAMDDRCVHRSYPLSAGQLDGDTVVCGYHGLRYDQNGDCIEAPAVAKCPKNIGVRTYPLAERGPVLWIWMGDPALADESAIAALPWMQDSAWAGAKGYYDLKSSYVYLHENLLDTSHLSYMHANTIGSPDYVKAPTTSEIGEGRFALVRTVSPTKLPPVWAKPTGLEGVPTASRIVRNEFLSPALYEVTTRLYDSALPEGDRPEFLIKVAHMASPATHNSTHYFIYLGRDFAQDDAAATQFMATNFFKAFDEDVAGLSLLEEVIAEQGEELYEISIGSDALGVAMRRYLKGRADQEASAQASAAPAPAATAGRAPVVMMQQS